ncbi:MAG: esterase-like activity of phytase family protein, partial [Pseudomonadota bacterium]
MQRFAAAMAVAVLPLAAAAEPTLLGSFHWTYPRDYFGGFSGIEVADNGTDFMTIGDAGQIVRGSIARTGDRITGVDFENVKSLHTPDGRRVRGIFEFDAEGLAVAPGGTYYVSFEHDARVWAYDEWLGPAKALPRHPDFDRLIDNQGLEALAIGPDGALYAIPEVSPALWEPRHVYRFAGGKWQTFGTLETSRLFWPVGADVGPDGRLYVLERRYAPVLGFSSRIRRFDIGETSLEAPETLLETRLGKHDNLEGLAVWRDARG